MAKNTRIPAGSLKAGKTVKVKASGTIKIKPAPDRIQESEAKDMGLPPAAEISLADLNKRGERMNELQQQFPDKSPADLQNLIDQTNTAGVSEPPAVTSFQNSEPGNQAPIAKDSIMAVVTLVKDTNPRKSSSVVYKVAGLRGSFRVSKTLFKDSAAPESFTADSEVFAEVKVPMTAEQRKEARKNAPKETPAEKLARLEKRTEDLRKKLAAAAA